MCDSIISFKPADFVQGGSSWWEESYSLVIQHGYQKLLLTDSRYTYFSISILKTTKICHLKVGIKTLILAVIKNQIDSLYIDEVKKCPFCHFSYKGVLAVCCNQ